MEITMVECTSSRAVMYVRMSTESQDYSTDHQRAKIREYAATHGLPIIGEYVDDGKSGLDIKRRAGLQALMNDVQSIGPYFTHIIVYDVSRWGRFQDIDEAAYHEHTCRRAGIKVVYCGERFTDDAGPYASLLKSMKRVMAAEYSRDLSEKVFAAQSRFVAMGFKQGGFAGYGLRRMALKACGTPRGLLLHGESKVAATDRVTLVWGPMDEVATVRRIYSLYLSDRLSVGEIARRLNNEQLPSESGGAWTQHVLRTILTNVKYCGVLAYNRRSCKLSTPRRHNAREDWVVNTSALPPIIDPEVFAQVQAERARRTYKRSRQELTQLLQACHAKHGRISSSIITADPTMPDMKLFSRVFGSLVQAYEAAQLPGASLFKSAETKRALAAKRRELLNSVIQLAQVAGVTAERTSEQFVVSFNRTIRVRVDILSSYGPRVGRRYWRLYPKPGLDFIVAGRVDTEMFELLDYLLIPARQLPSTIIYLNAQNLAQYGVSHFRSLRSMFALSGDIHLEAM